MRHVILIVATVLHAAAQTQTMTFFKLPGLNGAGSAEACYVNDSGSTAATVRIDPPGGSFTTQSYQFRNGKAEVLSNLPGYDRSFVAGINNKGEVLGRVTGPGDSAVVVWRNGIPTRIVPPPPSDPANRQIATPLALDNSGRVLAALTELTPAGTSPPARYYLLNGPGATELPPLLPGGPISAVFFYTYTGMNNGGEIAGFALVTRMGQLQVIGFVLKNGTFQEVLADQMFRVTGINQKGEVFGERNDGAYFVWRGGQSEVFPRIMASTMVTTSSFSNNDETCARVRIFHNGTGALYENAIVSFGARGGNQ